MARQAVAWATENPVLLLAAAQEGGRDRGRLRQRGGAGEVALRDRVLGQRVRLGAVGPERRGGARPASRPHLRHGESAGAFEQVAEVVRRLGGPLLGQQEKTILGRALDATIRFDVPGVSRRHASISVEGANVTVEDLGSQNGTYVRGEKIGGRAALGDGDELRLGPVSMLIRLVSPDSSTLPM